MIFVCTTRDLLWGKFACTLEYNEMMFSPFIFIIDPATNLVMNPIMNVREMNTIHSAPIVPNDLFGLRGKEGGVRKSRVELAKN